MKNSYTIIKGMPRKEYQQRQYQKNKDVVLARSAARYTLNKGKILEKQKRRRGIDPERELARQAFKKKEVLRQMEEKAGRPSPSGCEVCHQEYGRLDFDHDHETGMFRGWLCRRCNLMLGYAKDSPSLLRVLADYVEKPNTKKTLFINISLRLDPVSVVLAPAR